MKANMKSLMTKNICCVLGSLFLLAGCSVKQERVQNEPPVIKKGIKRFDVSFGTFQIQQASVFLWPADLTEDQAQELVKKVNAASIEVDEKMLAAGMIQAQIAAEQAAWVEQDCVAKWSAEYDDIEESVLEWKTSEIPEEQAAIDACSNNQKKRSALRDEIGPIAGRIGQLSEVIDRAVDPDPSNIQNKKSASIDTRTSFLTLKETDSGVVVELQLNGVFAAGYSASTENGLVLSPSFSLERRLLSFAIPEVGADLQQTGRIYQFVMERAPDVNGLARFQGDIRVYDGDKLVRYGSARFDCLPPSKN